MPEFERGEVFLTAERSYADSRVILYGAPMDYTVSQFPGARFGPRAVRQLSFGLETYSPVLGRSLEEVALGDVGDIRLPFGNVTRALDRIGEAVAGFVSDGKMPFGIGGDHLVTYPAVKAVHSRYGDLRILHFDAHADLRDDYMGEPLSHATVMRRIYDLLGPERIFQVGIRSGIAEEFAVPGVKRLEASDDLSPFWAALSGHPVYLTFDIDFVDPAFAPGTGTPEPGGATAREALGIIREVGRRLHLVGADLVEVLPDRDPSGRTAALAAKLIRELLLAQLERGQA